MRRVALVVDDVVPRSGWGAGYPRSAQIVRAIARCSDQVLFCPMLERSLPTAEDEPLGANVRALDGRGLRALRLALKATEDERPRLLWVGRPHNLADLFNLHRRQPKLFTALRVVYDAEAVFAARTVGARSLDGKPMTRLAARHLIGEELRPAEIAQALVTVSAQEQEIIRRATGRRATVIGLAASTVPTERTFRERRDLAFLGALWDDAAPNADSVRFFIEGVLPILAARIDARLRIAGSGSDRAQWLKSIAGSSVVIEGAVADLAQWFASVRVFVAPTRYGAGIPLKVIDAARHGVPIVGTTLIASQLGWRDGQELLVADDPRAMAEACSALYGDEQLWKGLRAGALAAVRRDFDPGAFDAAVARVAWGEAPSLRAQSLAPSP